MNEINDSWPRCLLLVQALEVGCVKQTGKEFAAWAAFLSPTQPWPQFSASLSSPQRSELITKLIVFSTWPSGTTSVAVRRYQIGAEKMERRSLLCMTAIMHDLSSLIFSKLLKVADFQLWPNIAYSLNFEVKDHECTVMNKPMFEPWKKLFWQAHLQQLSSIWFAPVILLLHSC